MMAWNEQPFATQQGSVSQDPLRQDPAQQGTFSAQPATEAQLGAGANLVNPLLVQAQQQSTAAAAGVNGEATVGGVMPLQPPSLGMEGVRQPPQPAPDQNAAAADDNRVLADDLTWINHARRAIAETQGDPHRQVQLLQHIRSQYLKQRFGRNVRTDEG